LSKSSTQTSQPYTLALHSLELQHFILLQGWRGKKKESSEKMDETWAPQNKDEEQQIMWLNKLPPGVKIPLTAEQMAKVAKMVKLIKIQSTYKHLPVML
jgi:hypothetical protein